MAYGKKWHGGRQSGRKKKPITKIGWLSTTKRFSHDGSCCAHAYFPIYNQRTNIVVFTHSPSKGVLLHLSLTNMHLSKIYLTNVQHLNYGKQLWMDLEDTKLRIHEYIAYIIFNSGCSFGLLEYLVGYIGVHTL
jgi:hypothetical protein